MKVYLYETFEDGESVRKGTLDEAVDVFIESIAPVETTADRSLWDMQAFLEKNYPERKFEFKRKEINVDWGAE